MSSKLSIEKIITQYIDDIKISDNDANNKINESIVLTKLREYSELIDKKIFDFTYEDFITMFNYNKWYTPSVFANRKCIILRFLDWCTEQNYCTIQIREDFKNRLSQADINRDSLYETEFFESFDELYNLITKINSVQFLETMDKNTMNVGVIYLVWLGLSIKDIITLKNDSFDYDSGNITLENGNVVTVKDSRIKGWLENMRTEEGMDIYRRSRGQSEKRIFFRPYMSSAYLVKSIRSETISETSIRTMISNFAKLTSDLDIKDKDYSKKITYKGVFLSGLYSRIKEVEVSSNTELSNSTLVEFDEALNGELLNGADINDYVQSAKARRIVREYTDYKNYVNSRG